MKCLNCRKDLAPVLGNLCHSCIQTLLSLLNNPPTHCTRCSRHALDVGLLVIECSIGLIYICTICVDDALEIHGRDNVYFDPIDFIVKEIKNSKMGQILTKYEEQFRK